MNAIFKDNDNEKYLTKDLNGGYNDNIFLVLDIYLNKKGPSVKIQQLNIFKDHHIVQWTGPTAINYDRFNTRQPYTTDNYAI